MEVGMGCEYQYISVSYKTVLEYFLIKFTITQKLVIENF